MASIRRQYPFHLIEPKWQQTWDEQQAFRAFNPGDSVPEGHPFGIRHNLSGKVARAEALPQKFYILDMFPYPSGAGLHVGHPEGYTATDILARYRRACGFNVLHPMGWDSFGLPAEQYAVKTGQHPRVTTEANIANFTRQIKSLGFSYDWSRELATTDPDYFKWTQWIFLKLYNSWFNPETNKAEPIETLKFPAELEDGSTTTVGQASRLSQTAKELSGKIGDRRDACPTDLESARRAFVDSKRLAYVSEAPVNWCPELGTVLANEEVIDGKSEVGGFPVVRKPMRQWMLRITAYAEKLLADLDTIDWTDSLKEMQRNWIGRSEGAEVDFAIADCRLPIADSKIRVFTTRPDTLFGATYMVLSPEHKLVAEITTAEQKQAVEEYKSFAAGKSDLERTELAKEKSGVFTGSFAINPVNGEKIPIWIADYVLASYGTGAIMAVPAHDERDFEFAKKFGLPIVEVVGQASRLSLTEKEISNKNGDRRDACPTHCFAGEGVAVNSGFLNGLPTAEAKQKITDWLEAKGLGKKTINYKLRDWLFSRQRYWGEPFPIVWKRDAAGNLYHEAVAEHLLPVLPPQLEDYKPTTDGRPPLARAEAWVKLADGVERETNTMPQWAGSCWYYLRYLDPANAKRGWNRLGEKYWMGSLQPRLPQTTQQMHAQIARVVQCAIDRPQGPRAEAIIGRITPAVAAQVRAVTGLAVSGCFFRLDSYGVRHSYLQHHAAALEAARGQRAVLPADFQKLPAIYAAPDRIEDGGVNGTGRRVVRFIKRTNGITVVAEEVMTGRECLALQTLFIRANETAGENLQPASDAAIGVPLSTADTDRSEAELIRTAADVNSCPGVDLYVGGTEHAVLHLLYARFWHKVLFDLGYVSTPEPFFKLVNQGLILGADGQKMSKSRGNVVNPDDVLVEYGADAFRLYEMFMGPLQDTKPWNTNGVAGVYKFLGRVWRLFVDEASETEFEQNETTAKNAEERKELLTLIKLNAAIKDVTATPAQLKTLHACIKKVTEDLDGMRFNTAISAMMVFVNDAITWETKPAAVLREFLILLQPFAPHIAEELWGKLNIQHSTSNAQHPVTLAYAVWPKFDAALLVENEIEIPVQVNGKLRDVIKVSVDATAAELEALALANEKARPYYEGKTIKKIIVVPKKLVNLVAA